MREWYAYASTCKDPDEDAFLVSLHLDHADLLGHRRDNSQLVEVQSAFPILQPRVYHATKQEVQEVVLVCQFLGEARRGGDEVRAGVVVRA